MPKRKWKVASQEEEEDTSTPYLWTPPREEFYLHFMREQVLAGNRPNGRFKDSIWRDCAAAFLEEGFPTITLGQLNSKRSYWRVLYSTWCTLKELSGWGIDPETRRLDTTDTNWDIAIKHHNAPARFLRHNPLPYEDDLVFIYSDTTASGRFAQGEDSATPIVTASTPTLVAWRKASTPSSSTSQSQSQSLKSQTQLMNEQFQRVVEMLDEEVTVEAKAQEVLESQFGKTFDEDVFQEAMDVVEQHAGQFVGMAPHRRLRWLNKRIVTGVIDK